MKPIAPDDDRLVFLPEDKITAAGGAVMALRDRWFSVCPQRGLLFWQSDKRRKGQIRGASPQCNGDETISRQLHQQMYPWAELRRYPLVLQPISPSDY